MLRVCSVFASLLVMGTAALAQSPLANPPRPSPKRGMTRAEVLARYGPPRHRATVDGAEVWYYKVKFNEVYGRTFAPFEGSSPNVQPGEIYFDPRGRVSRFYWSRTRIHNDAFGG